MNDAFGPNPDAKRPIALPLAAIEQVGRADESVDFVEVAIQVRCRVTGVRIQVLGFAYSQGTP